MSIGIGKRLGLVGVLAALPLSTVACSGQAPPPAVPETEVPPAPSGPSPAEPEDPPEEKSPAEPSKPAAKGLTGSAKENPVMRCGPRDSHAYIADYRCSDGTRPLGSDVDAGSAARRGNVGANSNRHIIDLYIIPCSDGPVEVYVDMYGCPEYEEKLLLLDLVDD